MDNGDRTLGFAITTVGQRIHKASTGLRNGRIFKSFYKPHNRNTFLVMGRLTRDQAQGSQEYHYQHIIFSPHSSKFNENAAHLYACVQNIPTQSTKIRNVARWSSTLRNYGGVHIRWGLCFLGAACAASGT